MRAEEKSPAPIHLPSSNEVDEWMEEFTREIDTSPGSKRSASALRANGVSLSDIADLLHAYTADYAADDHKNMRLRAAAIRTHIQKVRRPLQALATVTRQTNYDRFRLPGEWPRDELSLYSQSLSSIFTEGETWLDRLTKMSSAKGKSLPVWYLVCACLTVQAIAGRPHWQDIANLLRAAWKVRKIKIRVPYDSEYIRKLVDRYSKAHPEVFKRTKDQVEARHVRRTSPPVFPASTRNRRRRQPKSSNPWLLYREIKLPDPRKKAAD